ncbi:MAG TPA: DUF1003 domain-containing protein [Propionicimonas sp.]|jgi:uncharacterized membrane protein
MSSAPGGTTIQGKRPAPHLRPRALLKRADLTTVHPTVLAEAEHRAASIQLRVADAITAFAGSMWFVYLHVALFAVWMTSFEKSPWPTLTLIVSLEAIFLSTFVMIGQNRQAAFQQAKADHDYQEEDTLLKENTELTRLIRALTEEIHARVLAEVRAELPPTEGKSPDAG